MKRLYGSKGYSYQGPENNCFCPEPFPMEPHTATNQAHVPLVFDDPFQDAVPCFDWTPEAWRAVEYADTKLIKTPWGFKVS